jgi:radical SAM protein with 4Fe4S-binding SPASM domain
MYDKKRVLRKVDLAIFCYNVKYHNCYGNGIAITAEGNVLPCIMSRPLTLGNVKDQKIVSILANSKYEYYQRLTKDTIQGCKECAYRYGCFDCRALEMSATDNIGGLEYCSLKHDREATGTLVGFMQSK